MSELYNNKQPQIQMVSNYAVTNKKISMNEYQSKKYNIPHGVWVFLTLLSMTRYVHKTGHSLNFTFRSIFNDPFQFNYMLITCLRL